MASNISDDVRSRLARYAKEQPDKRMLIWLDDKGKEASVLTRSGLYLRAQGLAQAMKLQWRLEPGERILLVFFPGTDFVIAMMACLLGGYAAVPVYPPDPNRAKPGLVKLAKAVETARVQTVLSHSKFLHVRRLVIGTSKFPQGLKWHDCSKVKPASSIDTPMQVGADSLAFVQFSSGSTGDPKGVCVTHENLQGNLSSIQASMGMTEATVGVTWVPFYHDMGLVGAILTTIFSGCTMVAMSPITFLQNPFIWLNAISKYRGTTTCAPNFAYALAVRKIPAAKRAKLDLRSCIRYSNGAEPVRVETLQEFLKTFAPQGVKPEYLDPFYGMAENVVLISTHRKPSPPLIIRLKASFAKEPGTKIELAGPNEEGQDLAGNGEPGFNIEVAIVHPDSHVQLDEDTIGEIWVAGPSKVANYMDKPEQSTEQLNARLAPNRDSNSSLDTENLGKSYLRTGDMGFFHQGEVFVCGRIKDMIIVRGRNIFPQDVEVSVDETSAEIRPGCCAAFALEGTEDVVVVAEVRDAKCKFASALLDEITSHIVSDHSIRPVAVVLIKPRSIPKTTSGKIKRRATREAFLNGSLDIVAQKKIPQASTPAMRKVFKEEFKEVELEPQEQVSTADICQLFDYALALDLYTEPKQMQKLKQELHLSQVCAFEALPYMTESISLTPLIDQLKALLQARPMLSDFFGRLLVDFEEESLDEDLCRGCLSFLLLMGDYLQLMQDSSICCDVVAKLLSVLRDDALESTSWLAQVRAGLIALPSKVLLQQHGRQNHDTISEEVFRRIMALDIFALVANQEPKVAFRSENGSRIASCGADLSVLTVEGYQEDVSTSGLIEAHIAWNFAMLSSSPEGDSNLRNKACALAMFVPAVLEETSIMSFAYTRNFVLLLSMAMSGSSRMFSHTNRTSWTQHDFDNAIDPIQRFIGPSLSRRMIDCYTENYLAGERSADPASMISRCRYVLDNAHQHLRANIFDNVWDSLFTISRASTATKAGDTPEERLAWLLASARESINAPDLDVDDDLFEAGMSSIAIVDIASQVELLIGSDEPLEPDFIATHRTIRKLAHGVELKRAVSIELDEVPFFEAQVLPLPLVLFIQFIGIWVIFFCMAAAILPAYHYGYYIRYTADLRTPWSSYQVNDSVDMFGLLVPFCIPIWLLAFTVLTWIAKWLVVGRWTPREVRIYSLPYLRWWFVDRLLHIWELAVGRWLINTPMLTVFYILLGAKISPTAKMKTLLRDLDLFQIGEGANVKGTILCRVFDAQNRTLRFRKVKLGAGSQVGQGAVIMPGCVVAQGASVRVLQVLSEGEQVGDEATAYSKPNMWFTLYELITKFIIMVVLLVVYFNVSLVNWLIWNACGYPKHFRYAELIAWTSSYLVTGFCMSLVAVAMKWILIGRLRPGPVSSTPSILAWAADYLYGLVYATWIVLLGETRTINAYARGLGASIGEGCVSSELRWICPSNADMIRMGKTVISSPILVEVETQGERDYITIGDRCEIGLLAMLERGSVMESGSSLGSLSTLTRDETLPSGHRKFQGGIFPIDVKPKPGAWTVFDEIMVLFARILIVTMAIFALVPSYEFANYILFDSNAERNAAIILIAISLVLAMLMFMIVQKIMTICILGTRRDLQQLPCRMSLYCTYQLYTWYFENLLLPVTHGTPFYNVFARFMGANIGTNVIIQSGIIREHQLLTIDEGSIIDCGSFVTGHQFTNGGIDVGPTRVQSEALLHPGAVCLAHGIVANRAVLHPRRFAMQMIGKNASNDKIKILSGMQPEEEHVEVVVLDHI